MFRSLVLLSSAFLPFMVFITGETVVNVNDPITPEQYQAGIIRAGFSTNWFKTKTPMKKYSEQNIRDVHEKGFSNLRLRCRADLYSYDYSTVKFKQFLSDLTTVVDHCLKHDVIPIISWVHHQAEACAMEKDFKAYVNWWTAVARQLKDKDYRLSFNLFTELGKDTCKRNNKNDESLRQNTEKYNRWTMNVTHEIRRTGGNNPQRILILGSPGKTAEDLSKIDSKIYENDKYMMAEWHLYASGPNKVLGSQKYWSSDGSSGGQNNVKTAIKHATDYQKGENGLLTYLGAWMPQDNANGSITESEAINFARFFVAELHNANIPWSLNVLDRYYDTKNRKWLTGNQTIKGQALNMSRILDNIREVMP